VSDLAVTVSADFVQARRRKEAIDLLRGIMDPAFDELGLASLRPLREQLAAEVGPIPAAGSSVGRRRMLLLLKLQALVTGLHLDTSLYPALAALQAELHGLLRTKPRIGDVEAQRRRAEEARQAEAAERERQTAVRERQRQADARHEQMRFGPE
jgi:hypothetical protein